MAYTRKMGGRNPSKRLPRYLRNEDIPRDKFTPRTYQVELLDSAIHNNTIICMNSSSSRMFIAVLLMKEMATHIRKPLKDGGKRTFFLVDSDLKVDQIRTSIQHPCDFEVKPYTDKMGVGNMSCDLWAEEINRSQAFIMTNSQFMKLLQDQIISLGEINLLVFDDCHLILQENAYKKIMDVYSSTPANIQPRILGLTSSVLDGKFQNPQLLNNTITALEVALHSMAETSSLVIPERTGTRPKEKVVECADYEDTTGLNSQLCIILESAIDFLDECNIDITEELDNRDPRMIPKAALLECHNILTKLGPWCAACLADMLINQIEKIEKQKEFVALHKKFLKIASTTLRMLSKIFEEHFKQCNYSLDDLLKYSTPKVAELMNCLRRYHPETDFMIISEDLNDENEQNCDFSSETDMSDESDFSDNDDDYSASKSSSSKQIHVAIKKISPEDEKKSDPFLLEEDKCLCGIVFVEHQHEAYSLNKFIEEACAWDEGLCFVKSSHLTGTKSIKKGKLFKRQEETLRKFRMQELNLLVSTSILEEGVDVPKCNFVVRFDVPKSYKSYSYSKGRARARNAEFILLIEEEHFDEFEAELKMYHEIEEVLLRRNKKVCENLGIETDQSNCDSAEEICDNQVEPYVPSQEESHIMATMQSAIMLVNRYCAKLPSDAFTHLAPSCNIKEVTQDGHILYVASVRLPINSPIKEEIEGVPMSTKLKAKQAVAVKICEILHTKRELDDNLMPVGKEVFEIDEEDYWEEEEDTAGEARPGTTKCKQYYNKKTASALLHSQPEADKPCNLYVIDMKLTGAITEDQNTRGRKIYAPEETTRCFGILTSRSIPLVPMFPVFTRSGEVTVAVDLLSRDVTLPLDQLNKLKTFHKFLFSNVLRLEKEPMDYNMEESTMGYLIVPLNREDGASCLEIEWKFIDKVEHSVNHPLRHASTENGFMFRAEDFEDAVVMPAYRNIDQPQYFYVAEIRSDLNPMSPFPSPELYKTFAEYYQTKYGLMITNMEQPLLDVDHTSARLNLLIPRYMNQKGVPLPTSSAETKKARRENLQQKQILVPELCDIHVFLASLWRKAVCLPAVLYRVNYLLLGEEIRKHIAIETKIGIAELPEGYRFPKLDFGIDTSPENLKVLTESTSAEDSFEKSAEDKDIAKSDIWNSETGDDDLVFKKSDFDLTEQHDMEICERDMKACSIKVDTDNTGIEVGAWILSDSKNSTDNPKQTVYQNGEVDVDYTEKNSISNNIKDNIFSQLDSSPGSHMLECKTCRILTNELYVNGITLSGCSQCSCINDYEKADCLDSKKYQKHFLKKDHYADITVLTDSNVKQDLHNNVHMTNGEHKPYLENTAASLCNGYIEKGEKVVANEINKEIYAREECSEEIKADTGNVVCTITNDLDAHVNAKSFDINDEIIKIEASNKSFIGIANDELLPKDGTKQNNAVMKKTEILSHSKIDDVFSSIETFISEPNQVNPAESVCPEPLISLDVDVDLSTFIGPSPCEILQALTMSNANDFFSLERLETIGDSFLKYAVTVYLYCSYPGIHEGKLSYLRSKQVSNYNLYRLGKKKGLPECMISTKFEPYENWMPPGYIINEDKRKGQVPKVQIQNMTMHKVSSFLFPNYFNGKEVIDATPGHFYAQGDENKLLIDKFQSELEEADQIAQAKDEEFEMGIKSECQQSLTPYCLQLHHCLPDKSIADCVEALIGCYLTSCDKMAALQFMSWMGLKVLPKKEKLQSDETCEDNYEKLPCPPSPLIKNSVNAEQILEHLLDGYDNFERMIGYKFNDRSYLLQAFTHASYHYNTLTDCYQRLEFLGDAVLDYVITRHLYEDSDKYSPGVLTDLRSALVNNNIFAALAVKWNLHKYFKAISPSLFHVIEKFVCRQKEKEDEIDDEDYEADDDHEKENVELEVPKALGDIFESVAGAIYLDSGMLLDAVWRVFYRIMKPQIDKYLKNIPKSPVRELLEQEPETAKFEKPERTMDGKIRVTVNVVGKGVFTGVGRNYRIAKSAAAKKALRCIKTLVQEGLI